MSKYLLPICFPEDCPIIMRMDARTMEEAETRFINAITFEYDLDTPADWDEFLEIACNANILVGDISSIEEFE